MDNKWRMAEGEPLFDEKDLEYIDDILKRLLVKICINNNIGKKYFINKCHEFLIKEVNMQDNKQRSARAYNFTRMLQKSDKVTFRKLQEFCDILNINLLSIVADIEVVFDDQNIEKQKIPIP